MIRDTLNFCTFLLACAGWWIPWPAHAAEQCVGNPDAMPFMIGACLIGAAGCYAISAASRHIMGRR